MAGLKQARGKVGFQHGCRSRTQPGQFGSDKWRAQPAGDLLGLRTELSHEGLAPAAAPQKHHTELRKGSLCADP